ncbi:peptide-methionine (R)-S-oxide reductase [Idiomarina sp. 29L]|uniref:peptide-methionine (R)-S-oxide reductase MsrB n=1 Tax=Idiomarina sp. 29L TaxID=2508877 RepID=UPI00101038EB|nr:peptide-methionine (R)-S-oxide reductase MsrB [Idiomarina sp. 29L]RXS44400.1 peptide-methionine (R)-S-oxide reductase [Idiomarina sp. 29L]
MAEKDWKHLSDDEWKNELSDDAYYVLRQKGTERPFTGKYMTADKDGIYRCAGCGQAIFAGDTQFDSHCGWPSFDSAIEGAVRYEKDTTHGMVRVEVLCSRCDGHLGHVFDDGPTETGQRYCINSVAMRYEDE